MPLVTPDMRFNHFGVSMRGQADASTLDDLRKEVLDIKRSLTERRQASEHADDVAVKALRVNTRVFDPELLGVQELYTLQEVAALLSVSQRTVEDLVKNGDLASGIVAGTERARRVSRAQIVAFMEAFNLQNGTNRNYRKSPRRSRSRT
jgi:excisionase family DNA binding protein